MAGYNNKKMWFPTPKPFDDLLLKIAQAAGVPGIVRRVKAMKAWADAVGETVAEKTEAIGIRGDTLLVRVQDPSWANELVYYKDEILEKLHVQTKGRKLTDIQFITGSVATAPKRKKPKPIDLSGIEVDPARVAACIDEKALKGKPELRALLETMITNSHRSKKYFDDLAKRNRK